MTGEPPTIDPRIIGRLLLLQTTLHGIPTTEGIAEFLCRGLEGLPGTASILVRIGDVQRASGPEDAEGGGRLRSEFMALTIGTLYRNYGTLLLDAQDPTLIEGYRPFLENLCNTIALTLENRENEVRLRRMNEGLESSVQERTQDLLQANAALTQEIQERRQTEAALRESELRFRSLVEQAADGFELLDAQGRYLDVNSASCRQLGYSREEMLRLTILDVDPGLTYERYLETFQALEGSSSLTFEAQHRRKDGTTFPVEISTSVVQLGGVPMAVTLVRDITDRKQAEDEQDKLRNQLAQAQKLESVGQLAGGIAHDFNNILGAIVGFGSVLQAKMRPDDPLRGHIDQILAAAQRAAGLTQSLLAFSRKQEVHRKPIDLNGVVQKTAKFLSRIIGEDVALKFSLDPEPLMLFADELQIEQVLMNLATNARDAMPRGGTLSIVTARVENPAIFDAGKPVPPGVYAHVTVADTGTGMDGPTLAKIFEPFFTTKEVGRGTGLGLAIVYGAVQQNSGYIHVQSEPGRGTSFGLHFPLIAAETEPLGPAKSQPADYRGTETILLVEDDPILRGLAQQVLSESGYHVIPAGNGEEALEAFGRQAEAVQLLITDVIMPRLGGHDLYREARKRRRDLKVIFTSGYPSDQVANVGLVDPGARFLAKPASPQALLKLVRETLDGLTP